MNIVFASSTVLSYTENLELLIERAGRVCYKSEDRIAEGTASKFIEHLKGLHHESVLEHGSITVRIICDRGVSHELVRHRIASFSQESTRYCNYSKGKFGEELTFINPIGLGWSKGMPEYDTWLLAMEAAEKYYLVAISEGASAQQARSILPNSTKTEIVITANPREWRHIFKMRTSIAAHPQMREIMIPLLMQFQRRWPSLYKDIEV